MIALFSLFNDKWLLIGNFHNFFIYKNNVHVYNSFGSKICRLIFFYNFLCLVISFFRISLFYQYTYIYISIYVMPVYVCIYVHCAHVCVSHGLAILFIWKYFLFSFSWPLFFSFFFCFFALQGTRLTHSWSHTHYTCS